MWAGEPAQSFLRPDFLAALIGRASTHLEAYVEVVATLVDRLLSMYSLAVYLALSLQYLPAAGLACAANTVQQAMAADHPSSESPAATEPLAAT